MRTWWIAFVLGFVSGGIGIRAQPPAGSDTNEPGTAVTKPNLEIPTLRSLISFDQSLPATDLANALFRWSSRLATFGIDGNTVIPDPGFLKNLTIESFGYGLNTPQEFAFSPGYFAALFNLQGLECPRCVLGPVTRSRFTLPPFGALANLRLHDGRIELFAGFSGIEAWKPDGSFEPRGRSLWTNSYGDAWLTQTQAGIRLALDRNQRVSVGATGRYLYNFGSGPRHGVPLVAMSCSNLGIEAPPQSHTSRNH
jgi:hypothetical protein